MMNVYHVGVSKDIEMLENRVKVPGYLWFSTFSANPYFCGLTDLSCMHF
jgi:hypothetical protein